MQAVVPFLIYVLVFLLLWAVFRVVGPPWIRTAQAVAHRLARFLLRRDAEGWVVWVAGVVGLLVAVAAGAFFLEVAERIHAETPAIDRAAYIFFRGAQGDPATPFFVTFTVIGSPAALGILAGVVAAILLVRRHPHWATYLLVVSAGGGILGRGLKEYFSRARPDLSDALMNANGYAFPSGHALGSTIVFGSLAWVAVRSLRTWNLRSAALALSAASILSVCLSRLYLGVHWLSDIAGGVSAGIVWLAATTVAFEVLGRLSRFRRRRAA